MAVLRSFRNNLRSVLGLVLVAMICMSMLFFGADFGTNSSEKPVIVVDEVEITYADFQRARSNLERRYRQLFGEGYAQASGELNLNQQVADAMIANALLEREAKTRDLFVGETEIPTLIATRLFPDGYRREKYVALLRSLGMSSEEFEQELSLDVLREQYRALLRDTSWASMREASRQLELEETAYSVAYIEINPEQVATKIAEPGQVELEAFYGENASDYETRPAVAYDYLVFDPANFLDAVEVALDDVEFYYTEHQSEFSLPEEVRARHIQLTYAKEADPKAMAELGERARKVHERAVAGDPFEQLAAEHSDDIATKDLGGDLGWISKGKVSQEVEAAAFKVKNGGIADLVEADYGFHIVKVEREGYLPPRLKPLEEVQSEIERRIREQESPSYTAEKAQEFFDKWKKSQAPLKDFAVEQNLAASSSSGVLEGGKDPEGEVSGLTERVLSGLPETLQFVDLGMRSVIVGVTEHREPAIPALEAAKESVVRDFKRVAAAKLAAQKADEIVSFLRETKDANLESSAKAHDYEVKRKEDLKRNGFVPAPFSDPEIREAIFSQKKDGARGDRAYKIGEKYVLYEVTKILRPKPEDLRERVASFQRRATTQNGELALASVVSRLKAGAKIDIDESVLQ